jgi:O-antigen/teichoic acid export membrane protein
VGYGASILGYAVLATRRFNTQVPIHASVAATTFLMCWLLIPRFGTVGAVWGVLSGSIVSIAASFIVLHNGVLRFASAPVGTGGAQ